MVMTHWLCACKANKDYQCKNKSGKYDCASMFAMV